MTRGKGCKREVTVFGNFDKLSVAWLLSLPGPVTGPSSKACDESMADHLCLPPVAALPLSSEHACDVGVPPSPCET